MSIDFIVQIGLGITSIIVFVITFVRTGSLKKSFGRVEQFLEEDMKYKTVESKVGEDYNQKFTDYVDDYILNPQTNELEKLKVPKNIQKYIDSYIDSALNCALEKFLPVEKVEDNVVADYTEKVDDLASIGEAMEVAEQYREKYHLDDKMSIGDIYKFISKQADDIKTKLGNLNKKEVKKNESEEKKAE